MADPASSPDPERLRRERDLYLRLLELGHQVELRPLLSEVLRCLVDVTKAERGYIELYAEAGTEPQLSISRGCSEAEVAEIRAVTSRGIVARAMASGSTIQTASALLDDRFSANESVRQQGIEAVLCAPLGGKDPVGVLYLQRRSNAGAFREEDVRLTEEAARHVAPAIRRLMFVERSRAEQDQTTTWRQRIECSSMIGRSAALATVLEEVSAVARLDVTVLITGPAGTGKTHLARTIHQNSPRRGAPFVEVSCANIPETLFESELFGVVAGAHSTADRDRPGRVAAAEGGTLFLDEIGELEPGTQVKLLQLLQNQEYSPLGAPAPRHANIRILAATNADLETLLRGRHFREDLYYRLNFLRIRMPALTERRDDLLLLAEHFATQASRAHRLPMLQFSPGARVAIETATWPGNIRELSNVVQAALIRAVAEGAASIESSHLFRGAPGSSGGESGNGGPLPTYDEATRHFQKRLVEETLAGTKWNVAEAARRLDITRAHLYNLIKMHGLDRHQGR